jgi:serine kinase of HPr protein (carbohydrate metabolism regulator)
VKEKTMTVRELISRINFENLTGDVNLDREITSGYTSDLLSDVIANIGQNAVWITVQRHINILGVAKLRDVSAIVIPRNLIVENAVIEKAKDEHIAILRDGRSAFEISGLLYNELK